MDMMSFVLLVSLPVVVFACIRVIRRCKKLRRRKIKEQRNAEAMACIPGMLPEHQPLLIPTSNGDGLKHDDLWIAHGGGIGDYAHSNCLEAIRDSIDKGFKFIEIDFEETTDGHLVGGHTWKELRRMLGAKRVCSAPMSKRQIMALRNQWKKTPVFSEDICNLLQEYPHLILVTDKTQNFELLMQEIPYADRMLIEASDCYNYMQALRAGVKNVALSVWSMEDLEKAHELHLPGIVLSATVMRDTPDSVKLIKTMRKNGCCINVHWASICDAPDFIREHLGSSISRIYTDTWSPGNTP